MKSVCIVIPAYKSKGKLFKVIEKIKIISIELQNYYKIKTIVINDNCPLDSWKEVKNIPDTKIIHNKKNIGVGGSTLKGLKLLFKKDLMRLLD